MKVLSNAVAGVFAAVLAMACSAADWHTYHGDFGLTGRGTANLTARPERLWRTKAGNKSCSAVVGGSGMLFCIADGAKIIALTTRGEIVWTKTFEAPPETPDGRRELKSFKAPPLYVSARLLVVASDRGDVYGLSPKDGNQLWMTGLNAGVQSTPNFAAATETSSNAVLVISHDDGFLHALDPQDGRIRWKSGPLKRTDGHLAAADGTAVLGNCSASFIAVDVASGTEAKRIHVGEGCEMAGGVALDGGQAFAGNRSGSFAAGDLAKDKLAWLHDSTEGESFTTPAVTVDRVFFSSGDCVLYALNRKTGNEFWHFESDGTEPGSPIAAGGETVIGVFDGTLIGLDAKSGKELWKLTIGDTVAPPALIDGLLVIGTDDGHVIAYALPASP